MNGAQQYRLTPDSSIQHQGISFSLDSPTDREEGLFLKVAGHDNRSYSIQLSWDSPIVFNDLGAFHVIVLEDCDDSEGGLEVLVSCRTTQQECYWRNFQDGLEPQDGWHEITLHWPNGCESTAIVNAAHPSLHIDQGLENRLAQALLQDYRQFRDLVEPAIDLRFVSVTDILRYAKLQSIAMKDEQTMVFEFDTIWADVDMVRITVTGNPQ